MCYPAMIEIDSDYAFKLGLTGKNVGEKIKLERIGSFANSQDAIVEINKRVITIPKGKFKECREKNDNH